MPSTRRREDYRAFVPITTRWMDNDVYGHVNNVVYYSYFDTAVNQLLIDARVLDIRNGTTVGLVVETRCQYFKSIAFPDSIDVGVRVAKIGNSSVRYEVAIFANEREEPAAEGDFVHVYVERASGRPTRVPEPFRQVLGALVSATSDGEAGS